MTPQAMYTYAVAQAFDPAAIAALRGVDGAPVHLARHRDIVAVASVAPGATLDEAALRARLERADELALLVRAHHAVVAAVAAHAVTLPFRLAVIHNGHPRVTEMLRSRYGYFRTRLDWLAGRVELGVKVYVEAPATPPDPDPARSPASPGRDYLRRRRQQVHQRDEAWRRAASAASHLDTVLAGLAVDRCYHRPQNAELPGTPAGNVFNAAYLVQEDRVEEFASLARRGGEVGVRVEVTGPWAPYSFAAQDTSSAVHDEDRQEGRQ
jgi:hypothetical protein